MSKSILNPSNRLNHPKIACDVILMNGIPPVFVLSAVLGWPPRKVVVTPRIVTDAKILILYSKTPGTVPKFCQGYVKTVFYSHTFIFMLSSNKVWEKRLISGLSQAGTAWLRKSSRYDSRDFWAGLGGPSTSSRLR